LLEQDYKLRGHRSLDRAQIALDHLEEFFGEGAKVPSITATRVDSYAEHRLAEGAARASINYEKAMLRRGFRLAVKKGLLVSVPNIETPKVDNRRSGFFDSGELAALKVELTADVWSLVEFLLYTGWRRDEGRLLTWASVDKTLLETRWAVRSGLYVFHRDGEPLGIGAVRYGWKQACKRAGLDGRLIHDLRRTAARDMRRQGLSESDIMALCGWETLSMFQRYAIRDEAALEAAVGKRFGVRDKHVTSEGVAESTNSVDASSTT
jgi:integrase